MKDTINLHNITELESLKSIKGLTYVSSLKEMTGNKSYITKVNGIFILRMKDLQTGINKRVEFTEKELLEVEERYRKQVEELTKNGYKEVKLPEKFRLPCNLFVDNTGEVELVYGVGVSKNDAELVELPDPRETVNFWRVEIPHLLL